jgi:hypothetical protein
MMYVIGEFRDQAAAVEAIRMLREHGAQPSGLDVFSEEPVEFRRGVLDRPSRMSVVAVAGGIGFGLLATAFIYWTQHNYRLDTGGMPVFSPWATGVITFEMTMLGAIVSTFICFLLESGLARRSDKTAPVPEVDPGSLCLRVRCGAEETAQASDTLRRAGAITVVRRGDA